MTHRRSPSQLRARPAPAVNPEPLERRLCLAGDLVHSVGQLPTARQDILAVTVGNEAIFAGGTRNPRRGYQSAEVDVYDAHTRKWYRTDLAVVPQSVDVVNGLVVFSTTPRGGEGIPTEYIVFDPATAQVTHVPPPSGTSGPAGDAVTVAVGSKLVTVGGFGHTPFIRPSDQTEVFDATSHAVSTDHHLLDGGIPYAATVGNKAVFVDRTLFAYEQSGFFGTSTAEVYDADADQWTTTPLPAAHADLAVATVDDVALFAGGRAESIPQGGGGATLGGLTAAVDLFHADTNTFTTASLSQARQDIAAGAVGHYALFAGGTYARNFAARTYAESVVDLYDARTGQWSTASLSTPRANARVAVAGEVALIYGGTSGRPGATIDVFNAQSGAWSVTTMPIRFLGATAMTVGQDVIFYAQRSSLLEIYDTVTGTWTTSQLSSARTGMALAAVNDTVLFAGGATATGLSNTVDVYTAPAAAATAVARHGVFATAAATRHPWDTNP